MKPEQNLAWHQVLFNMVGRLGRSPFAWYSAGYVLLIFLILIARESTVYSFNIPVAVLVLLLIPIHALGLLSLGHLWLVAGYLEFVLLYFTFKILTEKRIGTVRAAFAALLIQVSINFTLLYVINPSLN